MTPIKIGTGAEKKIRADFIFGSRFVIGMRKIFRGRSCPTKWLVRETSPNRVMPAKKMLDAIIKWTTKKKKNYKS
jgi:hypothetical protein